MRKSASQKQDGGSLGSTDGLYATNVAFYFLWFEFLSMSPSYELARRYNSGQWNIDDEEQRPADFDRVLQVYEDLGDVQRQPFRDWWLDRAFDAFGYQGKRPTIQRIANLFAAGNHELHLAEAAKKFVEGPWQDAGRQSTLIVAIPVGLKRGVITRRIGELLDRIPEEARILRTTTPKYELQATNLHRNTYERYLYALWTRGALPDEPLWKVGARAKISETYNRARLDPEKDDVRLEKVEEKYALKILTHRAIERGKMMAENAARGVFPSYKKCPHALKFDLEELNKMRLARRRLKIARVI